MRQLTTLVLSVALIAPLGRAESPAPGAASQPADTVAVTKGTIVATVEVDGSFEPVEPVEIRIKPESYQGELQVKSVVPHGTQVKQGEVILSIDPTDLQKQVTEAENALTIAKANLAKAESDDYLGEQADALTLEQARIELANAEGSLKWWEEVDGKQMLTMAELSSKNSRASVEDQNDELEQLRKMYKTEELTNATADIVVKRALRQLDQSKIMMGLNEQRETKVKSFDYVNAKQRLVYSIEAEKQQLAQLKAAQEQQRILRKTAVVSARIATDKADKKVNELRSDLEGLTVHATSDGVVYFGQLSGGSWQNSGPKALRVGEKTTAGQVVMTLVRPGKMRLVVEIPEAKLNWVASGSEARVVPTALPDASVTAKCAEISPTPAKSDGGQGYQARFDVPSVDPKLLPGMKATVRIDAGTLKDVLVVPASAVSKGRVKVKEDGKDVWRDVAIGKSDGDNVEIRAGLKEGDLVVTKGGK